MKEVLFFIDDIGIAGVGAYAPESEVARPPLTPNIDALATNGIRYRQCRSQMVCGPSRVKMLTGQEAFRTGVGTNVFSASLFPDGTESWIPGQDSRPWGMFGKFHFGNAGNGFAPQTFAGFDIYQGPLANLVGNSLTDDPEGGKYNQNFYFWTQADSTGSPAPLYDVGNPEQTFGNEVAADYSTTRIADDAVSWIESQGGDFVAYVAFNAVHDPLHLPPANLLSVESQAIRQAIIDAVANSDEDAGVTVLSLFNEYTGLGLRKDNEYRWEFIRLGMEAIDTEIGRILAATGIDLTTDTTAWVTADNGPKFDVTVFPEEGGHSKGTAYDTGVLVPFIVRGARVAGSEEGNTCDALVSLADIPYTFTTLDGETLTGCEDANDFSATLSDTTASGGREFCLSESWQPEGKLTFTIDGLAGFGFVDRGLVGDFGADGIWKLIRDYNVTGQGDRLIQRSELYRIDTDRLERVNLLQNPEREDLDSCNGDCVIYTALRRLQREFDALTT